ncbi:MAG: radical SAM protein [Spirochaetes bacterium]|nr:radical SAM protein [Spirochaetota bacterium]
MNILFITLKLILKGIKYRFYKLTGISPATEILSLEITQRCIARCIMCNIWKTPHDNPECSVKEWINLLSARELKNLKELDITGGEPFIRNDLPELLGNICELKSSNLKKLKSIAITSNGFLTDTILPVLDEILPVMEENKLDLIIVFAMDAIGEIHNKIRNFKNGWDKLNTTIQGAIKARKKYGNLIIGLKTTILPVNINELDSIMEYAERNNLFTIISPCIITKNRYNNTDLENNLIFSENDISKMIGFYASPRFLWSYHKDMLVNFFKNKKVKKPCSAGFNYYFIRSTGDIFSCPLIKANLGNFKNSPLKEILTSKTAKNFRKQSGKFKECISCTEPGLERYALPFEGFHYLKIMFKSGGKNFLSLHQHMGLDKYF